MATLAGFRAQDSTSQIGIRTAGILGRAPTNALGSLVRCQFSGVIRRSGWVGSKWKSFGDGVVNGLRALSAAIFCLISSSPNF
jgi:hypothetical protein